jgi:hypothetical protein
MDALDEQIAVYESLLPQIKRDHGSVWALVARSQLVSTFRAFSAASRYARRNFEGEQVLIRHTDEKPVETAPFVHVNTGP